MTCVQRPWLQIRSEATSAEGKWKLERVCEELDIYLVSKVPWAFEVCSGLPKLLQPFTNVVGLAHIHHHHISPAQSWRTSISISISGSISSSSRSSALYCCSTVGEPGGGGHPQLIHSWPIAMRSWQILRSAPLDPFLVGGMLPPIQRPHQDLPKSSSYLFPSGTDYPMPSTRPKFLS